MLTLLKYRGENEKSIGRKNIIFNGIDAFRKKYNGNTSSSQNITLNFDDQEGNDDDDNNVEQEQPATQSQPSAEQSRQTSSRHSVKIDKSNLKDFVTRLANGLRGMNGDDKDKNDY